MDGITTRVGTGQGGPDREGSCSPSTKGRKGRCPLTNPLEEEVKHIWGLRVCRTREAWVRRGLGISRGCLVINSVGTSAA